jgi:hypothetical protein
MERSDVSILQGNSPAFVGVTEKNGEYIDEGVADLVALMPSR